MIFCLLSTTAGFFWSVHVKNQPIIRTHLDWQRNREAWKYFFLTMSFFSLLFSFNLNFSINHCFSSTPPQLSLPENSNSFNVFPFTIVFDRIIITSLKLNKHSNLQQFFHTQQCPWRPILRGHNYNVHPLLAQITVPVEKKQKADNAQISSVKHINKNKINDILRTKLFWCTSTTVRFTIHVISPIEVALLKITMSQTLNIQYSMFVLPKIQQAKIILNSCRLCKCSKAKKSCYNAFGDWVVVCEIAWLWTCLLDPEAWVV